MAVLLGWSADSSPRADTVKVDRGRFRAPRGVGARGLACMEVLGIRRAFHRQRALTGTQPIASRLERYRRAAASCDTRRPRCGVIALRLVIPTPHSLADASTIQQQSNR
jgi:hypothetical protein